MGKKVTIEVDIGDAEATYLFLRDSVERLLLITEGMPADKREFYLDQPQRWDRIAIALGEAAGEVSLPSLIPEGTRSNISDA